MKNCRSAFLSIAIVASALSAVGSDSAAQAPQKQLEQKVTIGTSEVLLDVVVSDNKGRSVKNLGASDFEIYEDGVKQQIQSFRLYQRGAVDILLRRLSAEQCNGAPGTDRRGDAERQEPGPGLAGASSGRCDWPHSVRQRAAAGRIPARRLHLEDHRNGRDNLGV